MPSSSRARPQRRGLIEDDGKSKQALVILDMISCWTFPDAPALAAAALKIAPVVAHLKQRCRRKGIPVVYANDNSGQWRSDFKFVVKQSLESAGDGGQITRLLEPGPEDYFVLKPKHSAFFATPLEILLDHLGTRQLVIAGVAGDQCIVNTASDARMRDFEVTVPSDGIASLTPERNRRALRQLTDALEVKVMEARAIRLAR